MGLFSKKINALYYPGCLDFFKRKENFEIWKDILTKLGIDYKLIEKNICCGLPALESGYDAEARKLTRRNYEIFKEEKIKEIITSCPMCYKMFSIDYNKLLPEYNIEVKNIWKIIAEKLEEKYNLIKNMSDQEIGYQDSCYLGRYCNIYQEPREILEMLGFKIKELKDNRENSMCSGSCGGLPRSNPEIANKIAREKLLQFKRAGINKIVVCSSEEYLLLNNNSGQFNIQVLELSEVIASALGIRKKSEIADIVKEEDKGGELI